MASPAQSPADAPAGSRRRARLGPAALSGLLAAAAALAATELVAALVPGGRSLVLAVGDLIIDSVPGWLERAAIATLGRNDKPVLVGGILVVAAGLGIVLGITAARRFVVAPLGLAVAGAFGLYAGAQDTIGEVSVAAVSAAAGVVAGTVALWLLLRAAAPRVRDASIGPADERHGSQLAAAPAQRSPAGMDRRRFVGTAAATAGLAVAAGFVGRSLADRRNVSAIRAAIALPPADIPAPPVPPGADLELAGLSPLFTPNEEFFRIDTALTVPQVDPAQWSLSIEGMVDEPFTLSYDELLAMRQIEADITLACVSNEVGGELVGNARWQGVPLRALLERAGVQDGATQIVGRSVDGFTAGFPAELAFELDEAMVAVSMNGEPLPPVHGFPARLVVPGLYGYVSATKWLSSIELTTFEETVGYWVPRGWAREGPIKTQSRIDVPAPSSTVPAGRQPIAGVAWAPTRGIERVEVRIDDGDWIEAELADRLDVDTWRQWFHRWDAEPGRHTISVRATDGTGEIQTPDRAPVAPDGATGHHTIEVVVEAV